MHFRQRRLRASSERASRSLVAQQVRAQMLPANPQKVRLFAQESYIDEKAIAQMQAVAGLEGVLGVCGMPDLHPGDRFPIGCTMIAEGNISCADWLGHWVWNRPL